MRSFNDYCDPQTIMATKRTRRPVEHALVLIEALLDGQTLDRRSAAKLSGLQEPASYQLLRSLKQGLDCIEEIPGRRWGIRLPAVRSAQPTNEQVVAAAFGASLARLFQGSRYEQAMRDALRQVVQASEKPARYEALGRKFLFIRSCGEPSLPRKGRFLDLLVRAVLDSRFATVRYREFDGTIRHRPVEPLSLGIYDHQLYVIARLESGELDLIRFSRVLDVSIQQRRFEYPDDSEYPGGAYFESRFGIMRGEGLPEHVVVRLDRFWANYAKTHRWHRSQQVLKAPDGAVDVHLEVRICDELVRWVLWFGQQAEVVRPARLAEAVAKHVAGMARRAIPNTKRGP